MTSKVSNIGRIEAPFVSICIPTYNRSEKVLALVTDLLDYDGDDVEFVVVDNCSTDDTAILLKGIDDSRFRYIQHEQNIGGPLNHLKSLTLANGEYAFLCLDKDRLDPSNLKMTIERLRKHPDVAFGYCALNITHEFPDLCYQKGYDSLLHMAYLSSHPSGMFYKVVYLKQLPKLQQIFIARKKFGFYPDVINGEMAMYGSSLLINLPLFYTESIDDCADVVSFTYSGTDLFFALPQRIQEFNIYLDSILNLPINNIEMSKLIATIFYRGIIGSTVSYRAILNDAKVCQHYQVAPKTVSLKELISNASSFTSNFMQKRLPISYLAKLKISTLGTLRVLYLLFKS